MSAEQTGTPGNGVAWKRPLPTAAEDGSQIVYVAVPSEDSLQLAAERFAMDLNMGPRIHAVNMAISARQYTMKEDGIDGLIRDASAIEAYLSRGEVPHDQRQEKP